MQLLAKTTLGRYGFGLIKKLQALKGLKSSLPIRNGGIKTIKRDVVQKYFNLRYEESKVDIQNNVPLIRSVADFKAAILADPVLRMCFQGALESIPSNGVLSGTSFDQVFYLLSNTATSPPKFHDESITGVPFYALFIDFLDTRFGQAFFTNPIVNYHIKQIFDDYQIMLCSNLSLTYMNTDAPFGWFSPAALTYVNYDDYYVDRSQPHWGFSSWNDWFTRAIRPQKRPVDPRPNAIVNSSDSYPLYYKPGQTGSNPATNVQGYDNFWLKDNNYSLFDMLGADKMGLKPLVEQHFVGGTVYQAFLDPFCYHRWHSPVSGTLVKSYKLGGTYYLDNPDYQLGAGNTQIENYIDSQPMLSVVSVRQIFIIKLDDGSNRHVAVIEIGMAEVSSCQPTVIQGQKIKKGDQLGFFQFGGSSHAVIFDKNFKLNFNPSIHAVDSEGNTKKQLVGSWLATFS